MARRPTADDGVLVVDKPEGWTSHDVVARVRRLAGTRKVGHAGTLDPMATGVLVVGIGRATRLLTFVTGADKEYLATVRLGVTTSTDDAEGETLTRTNASGLDEGAVRAEVGRLTGDLLQVPSSVSAIKVDGQRAYALARSGQDVQLAARPVRVERFEVLAVRRGEGVLDLDVLVTCSSGTYVRALARDLGAALGVGGHLTALRRTRVAGFTLAGARTLPELEREAEDAPDRPISVVGPAQAARAALPVRVVDSVEARELSYGRPLAATGRPGPIAAIGEDDRLLAVLVDEDERARPQLVMAPA